MPATTGKAWLVKIHDGASFNLLAKQQGGGISFEADGIDITSKDSDNWEEHLHGIRRWTLTCDGLIVQDDTAFGDIISNMNAQTDFLVHVLTPDTTLFEGLAMIQSFPLEFGYTDGAKYTATLKGTAAPTKLFTA